MQKLNVVETATEMIPIERVIFAVLVLVLVMGCSVSVGCRSSDREIASSVPGRCIAG